MMARTVKSKAHLCCWALLVQFEVTSVSTGFSCVALTVRSVPNYKPMWRAVNPENRAGGEEVKCLGVGNLKLKPSPSPSQAHALPEPFPFLWFPSYYIESLTSCWDFWDVFFRVFLRQAQWPNMQKSTKSFLVMGEWYEIIDQMKRNCVLLKVWSLSI